MPLWTQPFTVKICTAGAVGTAIAHLGIEFLEVGDDFVRARSTSAAPPMRGRSSWWTMRAT